MVDRFPGVAHALVNAAEGDQGVGFEPAIHRIRGDRAGLLGAGQRLGVPAGVPVQGGEQQQCHGLAGAVTGLAAQRERPAEELPCLLGLAEAEPGTTEAAQRDTETLPEVRRLAQRDGLGGVVGGGRELPGRVVDEGEVQQGARLVV